MFEDLDHGISAPADTKHRDQRKKKDRPAALLTMFPVWGLDDKNRKKDQQETGQLKSPGPLAEQQDADGKRNDQTEFCKGGSKGRPIQTDTCLHTDQSGYKEGTADQSQEKDLPAGWGDIFLPEDTCQCNADAGYVVPQKQTITVALLIRKKLQDQADSRTAHDGEQQE